ncbi:hypothetical protein D3C79_735490 [compost metagenome]
MLVGPCQIAESEAVVPRLLDGDWGGWDHATTAESGGAVIDDCVILIVDHQNGELAVVAAPVTLLQPEGGESELVADERQLPGLDTKVAAQGAADGQVEVGLDDGALIP